MVPIRADFPAAYHTSDKAISVVLLAERLGDLSGLLKNALMDVDRKVKYTVLAKLHDSRTNATNILVSIPMTTMVKTVHRHQHSDTEIALSLCRRLSSYLTAPMAG